MNNNSSDGSSSWGDITQKELIIESTLLVILALCILFGNALVCIAFATDRKLQTTTNCFVVSLACSDIIVGAIVIPLYIYTKSEQSNFNSVLYNAWWSFEILVCSTSICNLVAISLERCLSVKVPAIHRNLSRNITHVVIAVVWLYGIFVSSALLNAYTMLHRKSWHALYLSIMSFFMPLLIIIVAYIFIFHVAISRNRRNNGSLTRELRIAITIAVVIGAFVCAWTPFFVLSIIAAYKPDTAINWKVGLIAAKWLQYLNSVVNPIIYTYGNQDFRKAFVKLLRCFKNHRPRSDSRATSRSRADSRLDSRSGTTVLTRATDV